MSLYIVKNDKGEYWDFYDIGGFWQLSRVSCSISEDDAKNTAKEHGGHVVELVEKPTPVVVSEAEAEMLEQAECDDDPAEMLVGFVNSHDQYDDTSAVEDRLMRAYVNGWTVEKQKRWNVKVPHTNCGWYFKCEDDENENPPILDELGCDTAGDPKNWDDSSYFTAAEIEHYGLQDCEKVEVTDDEQ